MCLNIIDTSDFINIIIIICSDDSLNIIDCHH